MLGLKRTGAARFVVLLPVLLLLLAPLRPADAGDAARRASDPAKPNVLDLLDITVYFDYHPDEIEVEKWVEVFELFSDDLYDATEGQLRLGEVKLTTCSSMKNNADVWVHERSKRACANLEGVEQCRRWIHLFQIHQCTGDDPDRAFTYIYDDKEGCDGGVRIGETTCGTARGQFGLLHEAGHYLFGLRDEYKGSARWTALTAKPAGGLPDRVSDKYYYCARCEHNAQCSKLASVMDGGTNDEGRNARSEFCVTHSSDETFGHQGVQEALGYEFTNAQEKENVGSCWDTLAGLDREGAELKLKRHEDDWSYFLKHRLFLDPIDGLPKTQPPPGPPPTCDKVTGKPAFVLLIDTSRSMGAPVDEAGRSRLALARESAKNAIQALRGDELIGVIAFNSEVELLDVEGVPVAPATEDRRAELVREIDALEEAGNTATGLALQQACEVLGELGSDSASSKSIILLSDGVNTVGMSPQDVLGNKELCKGVRIHTIAIGANGGDVEIQLKDLAERTGGIAVAAQDPTQLPEILVHVVGEARGETALFAASGLVANEAKTHAVWVTELAEEVSFHLTHDAGALLRLDIMSPSGEITVVDDTTRPVRIPDPETGGWEVSVVNTSAPDASEEEYHLLVTADAPRLAVGVNVRADGAIQFPAPIPIEVIVVADVPVGDATVKARVIAPDGDVSDELELYDDGTPEHGDLVADDGIYSVLFFDYTAQEPGVESDSYAIEAEVVGDCATARGVSTCPEDGPDPETEVRIPTFQARADVSVIVTGVPEQEVNTPGRVVFSAATVDAAVGPVVQDEIDVTEVMPFTLTVSNRTVKLMSLVLSSTGTGDERTVDEVSLFNDWNADGLPDNRNKPLATSRFNQDDGTATFRRDDGMLAWLRANETTHFVIGFGSRRGEIAPLVLQQKVRSSGSTPALPTFPWEYHLAALLTILAVAWPLARHSARRPLAVGACICLGFVFLVTGGVGCGCGTDIGRPVGPGPGDVGGPEVPNKPGTYSFGLSPDDFRVEGAGKNGSAIIVTGEPFTQVLTITAPEE